MPKLNYREALRAGLRQALLENDKTFLVGEDVGKYGGAYGVSKGLLEEFGPLRVRDAPLSESGFVGVAIGAAIAGMRPIVEIMTVNFSLLALDQLVNNAATLLHMTGGQINVPLVVRMTTGAGRQLAAQHSHSWEGWFAHIPGLKIIVPATPVDARFSLIAALQERDPVLIFEHAALFATEADVPDALEDFKLEGATVARGGNDLTLLTYGASLQKALQAAEILAAEGVSCEVINLRCLRPLDQAAILASVRKTARVLIVDEGWRSGGISAELAARIAEQAFYELDAPVKRICGLEVPIPYAKHEEDAAIPQTEGIVAGIREVFAHHV